MKVGFNILNIVDNSSTRW